jgi:hypothetical protein
VLLRRSRINSLQVGEFTLDRAPRKLLRASHPIALPGKAFGLAGCHQFPSRSRSDPGYLQLNTLM